MLKLLRHKHVSKIILLGILVLILPAFVMWGTANVKSGKDKGPTFVGMIDNKKVSFDDFYESLTAIKAQVVMNYYAQPEVINIFLKNKRFMGKLAWDRLIMAREAKKHKFNISDSEVSAYVKSAPIFIRGGEFDARIYDYVLRNNFGIFPRNFEEIIRENLKIQKLNDLLTKDISASEEDTLDRFRRDNVKFMVSYVLLPTASFLDKVKISEEELKGYYESNKNDFLVPIKDEKTGEDLARPATFDEVRANIASALSEGFAVQLAMADAVDKLAKVKDLMDKEKLSFEAAAEKMGLKIASSIKFGRSDYLEGVGEAAAVAETASKMKVGDISSAMKTRSGAIFFKLTEAGEIDKAKFDKEREDYSKKALDDNKNAFLEGWLRELETKTTLNIDFGDYEKYYR